MDVCCIFFVLLHAVHTFHRGLIVRRPVRRRSTHFLDLFFFLDVEFFDKDYLGFFYDCTLQWLVDLVRTRHVAVLLLKKPK